MRAFQISKLAHPRDIEIASDVAVPVPEKGEVLVDVYSAGMNFLESVPSASLLPSRAYKEYKASYKPRGSIKVGRPPLSPSPFVLMEASVAKPPLPFVLGTEFAGKISKSSPIPKGCPYKPGDRVYGIGQGAYAEQVTANPNAILPMPDSLNFEQAAVTSMTYFTSYLGLVTRGQAREGDWVLVHAAAGGVGLAACQIAHALGCKVIAAASSDEKRRICKEKGRADEVLDYTKEGWQKEVMRMTGGHGVDIVYDPVGMLIPTLKCVAWNARLLVIGFAGGTIEKVPANLLLVKQASVVGVYWGGTAARDPACAAEVVQGVMELVTSKKIDPVVYEPIYEGLEGTKQGLLDLELRKVWGKAIVRVRRDEGVQAKL